MRGMIALPNGFLAFVVLGALMVGAFIGVVVGEGASLAYRKRHGYLGLDAALGAVGFVGGIILCAMLPYPENTVYQDLSGGGTVATTMQRYQHPYWIGFAVSAVLPICHELWRTRTRR